MRILHILTSLETGGAEKFVCALAAEQASCGNQVCISPVRPRIEVHPPESVEVVPFFRGRPMRWPIGSPIYIAKLMARTAAFRPDVIHCHAHHVFLAACLASRSAICYTVHSAIPNYWVSRRVVDAVYRRTVARALADPGRSLVLLSPESKEKALRHLGIEPCKAHVILNGIDMVSIQQRAERARSGKQGLDKEPLLLWVGRMVPEKNVDMAIRAAALLKARDVTFRMLICGDGPLRASAEALAEELGVADRITFLGVVDNVPELLSDARALWITSSSEGHPIVLLEAMAVGTPIIATNVIGVAEHLRGAPWAKLVELNDYISLASSTIAFLESEALYESSSAQVRAQSFRHSIVQCAQRYSALYMELLH